MPEPRPGGGLGLIRPMLATAAHELPTDLTRWAAEGKWDGMRALAYLSGGALRLRSRAGRDITAVFPELAALRAAAGGRDLILDGEIVAVAGGRPSLAQLQRRMHVRQPSQRLTAAVPVRYLVFDVLGLGGHFLLRSPYQRRREALDSLRLDLPGVIEVPPSFPGQGQAMLDASRQLGLEGVVLKRLASPYVQGRSPLWRKIKHFRRQTVVIGGWLPGKGTRAGLVGSLLLGTPGPGGLRFCGPVGTGFTVAALRDLTRRLQVIQRPTSPFASAVPGAQARAALWVQPVLVGEIGYAEWTPNGRLRHPVWLGLRPARGPTVLG